MRKVFIQSNRRQIIGAKVAKYSILKHSKCPEKFEVEILNQESFLTLSKISGRPYTRGGKIAYWDNDDLQSFTPLRFLPPKLMNYRGRAIVIDPDVFFLTDINELFDLDMCGKSIAVRPLSIIPDGPIQCATSVMLLECSRLRHWDWDTMIDEIFNMKADYTSWMSLQFEKPESILFLEEAWNSFDTLAPETKVLHNTARKTQPWKTGLELEYRMKSPISRPLKFSHLKPGSLRSYLRFLWDKRFNNKYQRHPDPKQERLFFDLLRGSIEKGIISHRDLENEVMARHVRTDIIDVIRNDSTAC